MKLLLLLSLIGLALSQAIPTRSIETNDVGQTAVYQEPQKSEEPNDEKKVDKRSYGWSPWILPSYGFGHGYHGHGFGHSISYSHAWPIYSHGWSFGWPIYYGYGWHGGHGWHGSHGWHSKW